VTITWWHNGNNDPLKSFWQTVATEYQTAHPNVKIEITALQNEDLRTRLTAALQTNDPPNLFQQWGGGEMADQVKANLLMDISDVAKDEIASVGGSAAGWQVNGKTYGLPWSLGVVGFWYNKAFFTQAGITQTPVTMDDFYAAIDKLKAAGIAPIAVGAAGGRAGPDRPVGRAGLPDPRDRGLGRAGRRGAPGDGCGRALDDRGARGLTRQPRRPAPRAATAEGSAARPEGAGLGDRPEGGHRPSRPGVPS